MKALHIHVGAAARRHIASQGLQPQDVRLVPAAAGGPKGLILNHLDQDLFGRWLPMGGQTVHLVGASIGAWRMASATMADPARAFAALAHGYIHQDIETEPGRKLPSPGRISAAFQETLDGFFGRELERMLQHPRWRLHVVTARGRQLLRPGAPRRSVLGFAGLAAGNVLSRRAVGLFMERNVFSSPGEALPLKLNDLPTRRVALNAGNFIPAMLASGSIPFMLDPVHDIPGAQHGAHWDGGIVDYHFHWPYHGLDRGLVLYPHFQRQVVPGWLDKALRWRHRATPCLSNMVLLAPNPEWVATLPGGKLPDRNDFTALSRPERLQRWVQGVAQAAQLADEWRGWLQRGCPADELRPL